MHLERLKGLSLKLVLGACLLLEPVAPAIASVTSSQHEPIKKALKNNQLILAATLRLGLNPIVLKRCIQWDDGKCSRYRFVRKLQ